MFLNWKIMRTSPRRHGDEISRRSTSSNAWTQAGRLTEARLSLRLKSHSRKDDAVPAIISPNFPTRIEWKGEAFIAPPILYTSALSREKGITKVNTILTADGILKRFCVAKLERSRTRVVGCDTTAIAAVRHFACQYLQISTLEIVETSCMSLSCPILPWKLCKAVNSSI